MDFIQALKDAEAAGISQQQFYTIWEQETRMKQMENELRLQQMKTYTGKAQAPEGESSIINLIDSRLQMFSIDQRQVQARMREELQKQNQALIADISRLLEGFASQVGRIVKNELHTVLEEVSLSTSKTNINNSSSYPADFVQAPLWSGGMDQGLTTAWSNVHEHAPNNQDQFTVGNLKEPAHENVVVETANGTGVEGVEGLNKLQAIQKKSRPGSQPSQVVGNHEASHEQMDVIKPSFSSLFDGNNSKTISSPGVHFIPEDRPANMMVFDVSKLSQSGKINKSPIFNLHDCPCKVQLSFWSSAKKELKMCVTFWGLSPQPLKVPKILTVSGMVKNWNSVEYTSLFSVNSPPMNLQAQWSRSIELPLILKTSRGHYPNITVETLSKRGYVCPSRDCVSINWTVVSQNYTCTA
ncbi:hypothetical protein EGW08_018615 [Elysia chlorotica]|uniref:Uncharacterized protein n=1 Tax=Elysia chlorotica TaxID=188477 RepID=A0A3S0ZRK0_ELYCH|nr:hypothetical protein EGW08_018615 [Elysia chlorotica]